MQLQSLQSLKRTVHLLKRYKQTNYLQIITWKTNSH